MAKRLKKDKRKKNDSKLDLTGLNTEIVRGMSLSYRLNFFGAAGVKIPAEFKLPIEIVLFYERPTDDQHVDKIELTLN